MEPDINEVIEAYIEAHTDDVSPLLQQLMQETENVTERSRWSIGRIEGKLLQMLIRLSGTQTAVEVGTFTGYSALLIAEALPNDGLLITCEMNKAYAEIAQRYFKKSPYGAKIQLKLGPALESLKLLPDENSDFVFIDADKPSYGLYFDEALRILKPGGLVFVDNVLWRNKIFKRNITNKNARAIADFNAKVKHDRRVEKVMLKLRDGVFLIRKI
ncbi:MAG: class I SAM-dependent methyltransferase [Desulfobacterales bacterium]|jgi:caffeoyl-CoA O-methyltransferase